MSYWKERDVECVFHWNVLALKKLAHTLQEKPRHGIF